MHKTLLKDISQLPVIDAHEHLIAESDRVNQSVDILTLFSHYNICDLGAAGMPIDLRNKLQDTTIPLEQRWELFNPYWEKIRHTSYARAVRITIRDIYGHEDISDTTYKDISTKVLAANKPGLYENILRRHCNIEKALTQNFITGKNDTLFKTVWHLSHHPLWQWEQLNVTSLERAAQELANPLRTAEDVRQSAKTLYAKWAKEFGIVGFKSVAIHYSSPTDKELNAALKHIRDKGIASDTDRHLIVSALMHAGIECAVECNMPVAVHAGLTWDNWIDFHNIRPQNIVPLLLKYREAKFDLYHAGIPWHDETLIIAKIYPNVWLNLCWCHIISQEISKSILRKAIDLIPINKIIGFGGDYRVSPENIYGHLVIAREDIAAVLTDRVESR